MRLTKSEVETTKDKDVITRYDKFAVIYLFVLVKMK